MCGIVCARALEKAVLLGDDTRPAACAESPWPMIVVTRDNRSRSAATTTAVAVAAPATVAVAQQVTTWSSGSPAAVCKMRSSAAVTVITIVVRLTAVLLLLMASARPATAMGQLQGQYNGPYPDICPSDIYCHGELLDDIQMQQLYSDSKTFVDKKLRRSEAEIIKSYRELKLRNNGRVPTRAVLTKFVEDNFSDDPLVEWVPPDFVETPTISTYVQDQNYKIWILQLNQIWKRLARRVDEDVKINPDRHSSIYLPNGFFIAGGRFTELYYWDSYWIIRGAILCDMKDSARGIIQNFLYLVHRFGYVPNGSRIYYLMRSQPPLLIQMAASYYTYTDDLDFIKKNIQYLEAEFNFWMTNRTIKVEKAGNTYIMGQYNTHTRGPRPESYYQDKTLATPLSSVDDKNELYSRLKAAAETGWDFSTKHYNNFGQNTGDLSNTDPQNFIYVELNAILQANAVVLAQLFKLLGNQAKFKYYNDIGHRFQIGINALLWNEEEGIWLDYDLTTKLSRKYFYTSNFAPLWTGSYERKLRTYYGKRVLDYLIVNGVINQDGTPKLICVPTSNVNSSQQWDYPNCWPPLQAMVIQGLDRTNYKPAQTVAINLAKSWINTNYVGYITSGTMFEKYSALEVGTTGGGGEYTPQTGFGWTNGIVFELFRRWGHLFRST
ncbi:trehalase-like [Metopolophium dirhodum]|uniref:trehalase-like n=1 Tax=Metopolophium dirhodum TaxID=44670 RepID=UPI0029901B06|nr:trehalase-like [Metopolophium dirhodum]XP_060878732.1 trehalase-like [Metopolophium dirhodum]